MPPILCPFCEKPSPPEARFCIACGGALHLAPCPKCGAVNDVSAASCFQCGGPLAGRATDTDYVAPTEAEAPPATARQRLRPAWIAAVVAILGVLVALGYYALATRTEVAVTTEPAPAREPPADARPAQSEKGAITTVLPERPAAAPVAVPPPARTERKPVESIKPPASKAPARGPQAESRVGVAQGSGTVACTAQALALGFCREAAKSQPPKAPAPVLRGDEACTQAAAALGLCGPASRQGGN
jgi:hypothetical protein